MEEMHRWIYIDQANQIWVFIRNEAGDLLYRIMQRNGEQTQESLIDSGVLEFTVYVDEAGRIHVVYGNNRGELRYCTIKDCKWLGKILYYIQSDKIRDIKTELIEETMHIFYVLLSNETSNQGMIMHCRWNGSETDVKDVQSISLNPDINVYYKIQKDERNNIRLFYVTNDEGETAFMMQILNGKKWSSAKRLYGIQGSDICFEALLKKEKTYILNKYKEVQDYYLDLISIPSKGSIQLDRIYKSSYDPVDCMLFQKQESLYVSWVEQGEIFFTYYHKGKWENTERFAGAEKSALHKYDCFIEDSGSIKREGAYGTEGKNFNLYLQKHLAGINAEDSDTSRAPEEGEDWVKQEFLKRELEEAKRQILLRDSLIQELQGKLDTTVQENYKLQKENQMIREERKNLAQKRSI